MMTLFRPLRVLAFDPLASTDPRFAGVNEVILSVVWEEVDEGFGPGPVGEYLEVLDVDPASGCVYEPVDLNHPHVLANQGLPISISDPQFHQQMVYAVAMTTIAMFERALGRRAFWVGLTFDTESGRFGPDNDRFVRRLRIYPHALREANAYYSPLKVALLFGYFTASRERPGRNLPGGTVFTCLSYDIVAHETTHALLDGLHPYYNTNAGPDMLAFHEAFADLVALFQHFHHPEVLRHQIAKTQGDLSRQNLLGQLAQQFGQALGQYAALRDALGEYKQDRWVPRQPDPRLITQTKEPHARGAILVAAVFGAYLTVYQQRIVDLLRIATGGSGVLPPGEIHPDLVNRLAQEAADTAGRMANLCIRAMDYAPPVDMTFGDFLRAAVTADRDANPSDPLHLRVALIESFRAWGIYPHGVRTLSEESLLWCPLPPDCQDREEAFATIKELFREVLQKATASQRIQSLNPGPGGLLTFWNLRNPRDRTFQAMKVVRTLLKRVIRSRLHHGSDGFSRLDRVLTRSIGLMLDQSEEGNPYYSVRREAVDGEFFPKFEVLSVRPARRQLEDGQSVADLVVEIVQERDGYLDPDLQREADTVAPQVRAQRHEFTPDFIFRGGCSLLVDIERGDLRYCISRDILSERRLQQQREFLAAHGGPLATYFTHATDASGEPFALIHRTH